MKAGIQVSWKWGSGIEEGTVKEIHPSTISRTIEGNDVTRHDNEDNPALVIERGDGIEVLKLESELNQ